MRGSRAAPRPYRLCRAPSASSKRRAPIPHGLRRRSARTGRRRSTREIAGRFDRTEVQPGSAPPATSAVVTMASTSPSLEGQSRLVAHLCTGPARSSTQCRNDVWSRIERRRHVTPSRTPVFRSPRAGPVTNAVAVDKARSAGTTRCTTNRRASVTECTQEEVDTCAPAAGGEAMGLPALGS